MSEHISMPTDNDPYPTDPHNAKNETQLPEYTQLARLGRTSWQRQVAAIATILFFWLVLGAAAALAVMGLAPGGYDLAAPSPTAYIAINVSPLAMLAEVAVAVRFIHQRPLRTLITPSRRIDWRRIACAFALMVTLAAASSALEAALYPGTYHLTSQPRQWLTMLPVILILTTLQTSAEELLFRGYLLQALGLRTRRTWLLVGISALVFGAMHMANTEVGAGPALIFTYYVGFGAFLALITLRDNRLELAIGAHAANNLFVALVVNATTPRCLPAPSGKQPTSTHCSA
jgi:membrane protease YdiL (CAAX protease family)